MTAAGLSVRLVPHVLPGMKSSAPVTSLLTQSANLQGEGFLKRAFSVVSSGKVQTAVNLRSAGESVGRWLLQSATNRLNRVRNNKNTVHWGVGTSKFDFNGETPTSFPNYFCRTQTTEAPLTVSRLDREDTIRYSVTLI